MSEVFRIYLDGHEDVHANMTLDVVLDADKRVKKNLPFCGWWGKIGSTDLFPIIVLPDGRVDTGSDEDTDQSERYGRIAFHDTPLELCGKIEFSIWDERFSYEITKMVNLCDL